MCDCYFCQNGREHPATHTEFHRIGDRLLVAESLRQEDRVRRMACELCGHIKEQGNVSGQDSR
jgi:hypothetical protein